MRCNSSVSLNPDENHGQCDLLAGHADQHKSHERCILYVEGELDSPGEVDVVVTWEDVSPQERIRAAAEREYFRQRCERSWAIKVPAVA